MTKVALVATLFFVKAIGVKILKNNLSRYLNMVRGGDVVYVTDRDEVVAEIRKPVSPSYPRVSRWESFLNDLEARGALLRAKRRKSAVAFSVKKTKASESQPDWKEILSHVKSDRFR